MATPKKSPLARFREGFFSSARGADFLLRNPALLKFAAAPFALSFVILSLMLWVSVEYLFLPFHAGVEALLPAWEWLRWVAALVIWPVALIAYAIFALFAFAGIANIFAGPFNDMLSLRTEEIVLGRRDTEAVGFLTTLGRFFGSLLIELKKIGFFLGVQILLLGTWVVPVIGPPVHAVLAGAVTCWFLAYEYVDYPMERRHQSYRSRLLFTWMNRYEVFGFGAGVALALLVPVVGFFALPAAVVGGTLLYLAASESR